MLPSCLGVIGLGAVGGSVAWSAARAGVPRVVGYALDRRDVAAAIRAGAVTEVAYDAAAVVRVADFVVLATPADATLALLSELAPPLRRREVLCTDTAVVKEAIVRRAIELGLADRFAGSHPFVDSAEPGFRGASASLFARRIVYVTPVEGGEEIGSEVADFWRRGLGADPVLVAPERHDDFVAWTTHLPQVVAAALAAALAGGGPAGLTVSRGALAVTAPAAQDPEGWAEALLMNRDRLDGAVAGLELALGELRSAIRRADRGALEAYLQLAARWRRGAVR